MVKVHSYHRQDIDKIDAFETNSPLSGQNSMIQTSDQNFNRIEFLPIEANISIPFSATMNNVRSDLAAYQHLPMDQINHLGNLNSLGLPLYSHRIVVDDLSYSSDEDELSQAEICLDNQDEYEDLSDDDLSEIAMHLCTSECSDGSDSEEGNFSPSSPTISDHRQPKSKGERGPPLQSIAGGKPGSPSNGQFLWKNDRTVGKPPVYRRCR